MRRRPWFEGPAVLASAGFTDAARVAADPPPPENPFARSLALTDFPPFAFATRLDQGVTKPKAFPNLDALARHIERRRGQQAIQLVEVEDIEFRDRPGLHKGVQIFTLMLDGSHDRCLGWAWLNGAGRDRLEPALRDARRTQPEREAA